MRREISAASNGSLVIVAFVSGREIPIELAVADREHVQLVLETSHLLAELLGLIDVGAQPLERLLVGKAVARDDDAHGGLAVEAHRVRTVETVCVDGSVQALHAIDLRH
jgi:hypothetical protein